MNRTILIIGIIILLILGFYYRSHPLSSKVKIHDTVFTVETAVTEPQKQLGLGGRTNLETNHGMLFIYDHKEQYNFWMKDMHFPLDFIWINGKTVADITKNVPPPTGDGQPAIVVPKEQVDKVLEINAGTIQALHIQPGDEVEFLDR